MTGESRLHWYKDKLVLFSDSALIPSFSIPEITMSFSSLLVGGWIRKELAEEDEFEVDFQELFVDVLI